MTHHVGEYALTVVSDGSFWVDGGAMFGVLPRVLWQRFATPDEHNRVKLDLNCLVIQGRGKTVLVDTGLGERLSAKTRDLYRVEKDRTLLGSLARAGVAPEQVDMVVNTHLHFDHCGTNTTKTQEGWKPTFPRARYYIARFEYEDALHPDERSKSSYVSENYVPLKDAGCLELVDGDREILPGISLIATPGHTRGHQSVMIESGGEKACYWGDLIPVAAHLRLPYFSAFDLYPVDLMKTKKKYLDSALREHWLVIFNHDPQFTFARLQEQEGRLKALPA